MNIWIFWIAIGAVEACKLGTYGDWSQWTTCSKTCGGGTQQRTGESCFWRKDKTETRECNKFCVHGLYVRKDVCSCPYWRSGHCCENCRHINIAHCASGKQQCGGYPDGIKCTSCDKPYYSGGYNKRCIECPQITHCTDRHCTSRYNTRCDLCEYNGILFKPNEDKTGCERTCAWDKHNCWPGSCGDGLVRKCNCAPGFDKFLGTGETTCQLNDTNTPSVSKCVTSIFEQGGEGKQTKESDCKKVKDFYGNFQPHKLQFDITVDFKIDISKIAKPAFIKETKFGVTDVTVYLLKQSISGTLHEIYRTEVLHDGTNGENAEERFFKKDTVLLDDSFVALKDGERFCVKYEAQGGGYLKTIDLRGSHPERGPYLYRKSKGSQSVCYRYDKAKPTHCLATKTCPDDITEPLKVSNRISRKRSVTVIFPGWTDPIPKNGKPEHASGIESYLITVHEVRDGIVDLKAILHETITASETATTLTLPAVSPRLYSITLEVKDVADNTEQARRFVLYDNSSYITTNTASGSFFVTSASEVSNKKWQTHHGCICLNWKSYFINTEYEINSFLGRIKANDLTVRIYDQTKGSLPVTGTENVYGIIKYWFSWSLNNGQISKEILIPDLTNQSYCHPFNLKDGQTYILNIKAVDIVNNTFMENRTVHIDRTGPHINDLRLMKNGIKQLFVNCQSDISNMELNFETFDPHCGLLNIEWKFGTSDTGLELGSGFLKVKKDNCHRNMSKCYCPDVGECETYNYIIPMNKLLTKNRHIGNHNRNYFFTIKVTNNAYLSNIDNIDILVDDSPPECDIIYEAGTAVATTSSTTDISIDSTRVRSLRTSSGQAANMLSTESTALPTTLTYESSSSSATGHGVASDKGENKQSISPGVGVIVGASVPAVVLVTAVLVVSVFLRRRRNIPDLCLRLAKTKQSEKKDQNMPTYVNVVMSPTDTISDSNYANIYSSLEPQDNDNHTYDILAHVSRH